MEFTQMNSKSKVLDLVWSAMLVALVFIATFFINIKLPIAANGGLVHLGSAMLFISSIVFGPKKGFIAGAFGMGLFDLVSGWTLWAPFTFLTRGLQGYIIGYIAWSGGHKGEKLWLSCTAIVISIPFMLMGYYICERILYNSWIIPFASIPGNLVQNIIGLLIAIPFCMALRKVAIFKK